MALVPPVSVRSLSLLPKAVLQYRPNRYRFHRYWPGTNRQYAPYALATRPLALAQLGRRPCCLQLGATKLGDGVNCSRGATTYSLRPQGHFPTLPMLYCITVQGMASATLYFLLHKAARTSSDSQIYKEATFPSIISNGGRLFFQHNISLTNTYLSTDFHSHALFSIRKTYYSA